MNGEQISSPCCQVIVVVVVVVVTGPSRSFGRDFAPVCVDDRPIPVNQDNPNLPHPVAWHHVSLHRLQIRRTFPSAGE